MTEAGPRPFKQPVSVLVVVFTRDGDVLVLSRRQPRGFLQSVTGSLKPGESLADCARRELFEETGLDIPVEECGRQRRFPIPPEWQARYAPGITENVEHQFLARLSCREPIRLNEAEHLSYCWMPRAEAAAAVSSYTNRDAILEFVPKRT